MLTEISKFIEDFQNIYTNIFTNEELENILKENVSEIKYVDELPYNQIGRYSLKDKTVEILKSYEYPGKVLFHELTHAITRKMNENVENKYFSEVLTTLAEEAYAKHYGIKYGRVNGYIPDFGHQLQIVYGDELMQKFYKTPEKIHELFDMSFFPTIIKESMQKTNMKKFTTLYNRIATQVGKDLDFELEEDVREIESLILEQLINRIDKEPTKDKLYKLEELYNHQHYPDYQLYIKTVDKNFRQKFIESADISHMKQLCNLYSLSQKNNTDEIKAYVERRNISQNNYKYIAQKMFGFEDYVNDIVANTGTKDLQYIRNAYRENATFYEALSSLILEDELDYSDIRGTSFSKENINDDNTDVKVLLKNGEVKGYSKLIELIQKERTTKYFINDMDGLKYVIEDGILLKDYKIEDLYSRLKKMSIDFSELGIFLEQNNVQGVKLDEFYLDDLEEVLKNNDDFSFFIEDKDKAVLNVFINGAKKLKVKYDLLSLTVPKQIEATEELKKLR